MPAELPGFYFDEERNRYFPLSKKPKNVTIAPTISTKTHHAKPAPDASRSFKRKRQSTVWKTTELTCISQKRHRAAQFVSTSSSLLQEI
jgi:DDB1- and CUL4-associated factor 4